MRITDKIINIYHNKPKCLRITIGNYRFERHGNIGAIKFFGNTICLLFPDGGSLFSNCGWGDSRTTNKILSSLGCDYHKVKCIDLDEVLNKLENVW